MTKLFSVFLLMGLMLTPVLATSYEPSSPTRGLLTGEVFTGTIMILDPAWLNLVVETPEGSVQAFSALDMDVLEGLRKGDLVHVTLDEQGIARQVKKLNQAKRLGPKPS